MADTGWCVMLWLSFVVFVGFLPSNVRTKSFQCPAACTCLGSLVDCSKRELESVPDDIPDWVVMLDLSSNKLADIQGLAGQGLIKLEELDLSNNELTDINSTIISEMPVLKELKLNYNGLTELPHLPRGANITTLALQHNLIEEISAEVLDLLPRLRHLDLGYNKIKQLSSNMFSLHPALHQLYLNNNRIRRIDKGALKNLPSLTWLKLGKNKIRDLPTEVFANLTKLQDLELSRNRLHSIGGLTFKGLTSLVTLKLDRNSITDLMDGAFFGPDNIHNLILDHNNITAVTKGWLYGLTRLEVLDLSNNRVSFIEDEVWTYCELLSKLDLRDNELTLISEDTFSNLGALQHLLLDNNHLSYIASGAFSDMGSLQVLELNNNEISWAIEDMNGAFEGLNNVKRLSLRNNHIKLIAKRAFDGLPHLQQLHLENNSLSSIQNNAFQGMLSLQELYINSSSLVCDCQLGWLPGWIAEQGFQNMISAKCVHPQTLKGLSIMEVNIEDFKCNDSPKPVIQVQPESQAALKGSNTTLECTAVSSDPSALTVQWRKDNILMEAGHVDNYQRSSEDGILELRSVLVLGDIQDEQSGVYQCVVSNNLGTAYSAKAEVTVNIMPYFIKTPEDVTAPAGTTARLECSAKGHPAPRIAWKKDGGDSFPAARERRLLMMPTDDVFFITKVNLEDEGVYSCTAENAVGTIIANATLKVLKKPVFEREMEDKVVEIDNTAVLECMATGSPTPEVLWLKDGEPLHITKRHFFTADNRFLVIYKTTKQDEGVYTCRISNTLAKEEGHSRLTVVINDPNLHPDSELLSTGENSSDGNDSMMTGIIIIAVVCCVVGTSLIWVIIIYKTRKRTEEYSSTPTDETTLPGDMPSTPFHSSERDSSSPGLLAITQGQNNFSKYPVMEVNGGFGYSPAKPRMAAIFPSDIEDDHLRQSIPLTSDEQQPAESSDNSINIMRRLRHSTGSEVSQCTPSPHHSEHSLHSNHSNILQTFQPHLMTPGGHTCQHGVAPPCEQCQTVAVVHCPPNNGHYEIVSEVQPHRARFSAESREPCQISDIYHGSQPPGTTSDESDYSSDPYSATFPTTRGSAPYMRGSDTTVTSSPGISRSTPGRSLTSFTPSSSSILQSQASRPVDSHHNIPYPVGQSAPYGDSCTDSESCQEEDLDHLHELPPVAVLQHKNNGWLPRDSGNHSRYSDSGLVRDS